MSPRVAYLLDATKTRIQNEDMYPPIVRQNLPRQYCLTPYYVKLVSLLSVSDINTLNPAVEFLIPQDRISKCWHSSLTWTRGGMLIGQKEDMNSV